MIHLVHTPAARLAHQRQMMALQALGIVLPPWVGLCLWAFCTPLYAPCSDPGCTFEGIAFVPAASSPPPEPSQPPPPAPQLPAAPPPVPSLPGELPGLAVHLPGELPGLPSSEADDTLLETDADALFTRPEAPASHAHRASAPHPAPQATAAAGDEAPFYTPPACQECPQPPYPAHLRARRLQGSVTLTLHLNADGQPIGGEITRSSGHTSLDQHALNWVLKRWQFTPARRGRSCTAASIRTTIHFTLR